MARRRKATLNLSATDARNALAILMHEGKIAASQVQKAIERREELVRDLKSRLAALGAEGAAAATRMSKRASREWRASKPARKRAISAAAKAARQAQGHYLAAIRQLSKSARKQIKAVREKSGVKAAIAAAKKMAR